MKKDELKWNERWDDNFQQMFSEVETKTEEFDTYICTWKVAIVCNFEWRKGFALSSCHISNSFLQFTNDYDYDSPQHVLTSTRNSNTFDYVFCNHKLIARPLTRFLLLITFPSHSPFLTAIALDVHMYIYKYSSVHRYKYEQKPFRSWIWIPI